MRASVTELCDQAIDFFLFGFFLILFSILYVSSVKKSKRNGELERAPARQITH